jgi:hypothetical protein
MGGMISFKMTPFACMFVLQGEALLDGRNRAGIHYISGIFYYVNG